jgi:hypothetical protein
MTVPIRSSGRLDALGAAASLACAVHCAALPALVALAPAIGMSWLASERAGWAAIGVVAFIAAASLLRGQRRHGQTGPLVVAGAGVITLVLSESITGGSRPAGTVTAVAGGVLVATAHLINLRLCRRCPVCSARSKPSSRRPESEVFRAIPEESL